MMRFGGGIFAVLTILSVMSSAQADMSLIKEMESLRNNVSLKDPTRSTLTLRLADMYFDEASKVVAKNPDPTPDQFKQIGTLQKRSLQLYQEAATGANGVYPAASGKAKYKIQFQIARLHSDLFETAKAKPLFIDLAANSGILNIQRESSLRLAEIFEKESNAKSDLEADRYYQMAIQMCEGGDVCSYARFRRAWLLHHQGKLEDAIKEMHAALYDSKRQIREESLRDYIFFLSHRATDGQKELVEMEELANKLARPGLVLELGEAFFVNGNRAAGTKFIAYFNERKPEVRFQARLLEEYYGSRNWDAFRDILEQAESVKNPQLPTDPIQLAETDKIMKRLCIQLDGERTSQTQYAKDFQRTIMVYLALFPKSDIRERMIDGWIAAEPNEEVKIAQVKTWIGDANKLGNKNEEMRLRKIRTASAQKLKNQDIIIEETKVLAANEKDTAKSREYKYLEARALYEKKEYAKALPLFVELAKVETKADTWATQSQNLALDIYANDKDYDKAIAQSESWLNNPKIKADPSMADELRDMSKISQETKFQKAASLGETPQALAVFREYCEQGVFKEKSCSNAKILAVKLKDQDAILSSLKLEGKTEELASEYEASAHFAEAAELLEKKATDMKSWLKVSILYELAQKGSDHQRTLNKAVDAFAKTKSTSENEEILLFQSLKDANSIQPAHMKLGWSPARKLWIAEELEANGKGSADTAKMLMASTQHTGSAWSRYVVADMQKLDQSQRKINFYGKQSQAKFQARVGGVKQLVKYSEKYLEGADLVTRVKMAGILAFANRDLGAEILNSPMPQGLDEASIQQLQGALAQMAQPFLDQGAAYEKLAREQAAKLDSTQAQTWAAALGSPETFKASLDSVKVSAAQANQAVDWGKAGEQYKILNKDPARTAALQDLKKQFEVAKKPRLAAYFEGRIRQSQGGNP